MDLLEYQAKELFREIGIPILSSQRIDHPRDLKGLQIPYPVVLKSQVHAGRRGRAGGIKFVENTIDAIAAAQTIFSLPIMGEYPEVILAESKYDTDQEFYLAVALDATVKRPILLGSQQGGIKADCLQSPMQMVVVDRQFSPFYARRLALKMGLQGELFQSVSTVVEKMYQLFIEKDLDLVEINPLGISPAGEIMALDGKITVNDNALGRHPHLLTLTNNNNSNIALTGKYLFRNNGTESNRNYKLHRLVQLDGNIGIICNGVGLMLTTLDLVYTAGGQPASFVNLGSQIDNQSSSSNLLEAIDRCLEMVSQDKTVKVVLVNIIGTKTLCEHITEAISIYIQRKPRVFSSNIMRESVGNLDNFEQQLPMHNAAKNRFPQFIVRLIGSDLEKASEALSAVQVPVLENLDEVVDRAVSLAKKS